MLAATLRSSRRWLADPYGVLDAERARRGPTFWMDLALVGRVLVTGDPALIREITSHPDLEAGSGISALRQVLGEGSLITLDGEAHAARRRLVAPFFRRGLEALDEATCRATVEALRAVPPGGTLSVYDLSRRVSLRAIVRFLLAAPEGEAARAERLVDSFLLSFESPWLLFLRPLQIDLGRLTPWGRALRNRERLRAFLREHVRTARSRDTGGGVLARIAREAPELSEGDIVTETLALLLFGHDTGAAALAWAFAHIWRRPEILARVREEAQGSDTIDPAAHPYLEACLKESLRLSPVVVHLTRVAARETRIGDHTVPAGARVFPCTYLAHRDPEVFPDPTAFQPERFLEGQTYEGSWFPFGIGARTCIGHRFALRQMLLTAAAAARCADLAPVPGWEPRPVRRLVLVLPEGGTRMVRGPHPNVEVSSRSGTLTPIPSPGRRECGWERGPGGEGTPHRVLVVTGGWLTGQEGSIFQAARKIWAQRQSSEDAWLDLAVKAVLAEPVLAARLERLRLPFRDRRLHDTAQAVLSQRANVDPPSLTGVVLTTLLHRAGLPYDRMELDDIVARPAEVERKLAAASCVFLSSTYLHDLSELEPLVRRLKRPHNRVVVGGALAGILDGAWDGMPEVDVLAVGYGERLIDPLAAWIRSGFTALEPPSGGHIVRKKSTAFLYSGVPEELSLDGLPEPDWELALRDHGRQSRPFSMAYYESVRGCPYRCNFCNYPYLFADTKFRVKSARRIADDWERLAALGVEHVTCLDSLFTMPRPRLRELCRLLLERQIKIRWICYARADDLADEETVILMREAGAQQVQIGIESGDPVLLDNMDKACTVESNAKALANCRRHGLTSVVSLIVGFPGETAESLERTYRFLAATPPDFYFLATFSTRVAGVPLLRPENRERFGLRVRDGLRSLAPYWEHATMSCAEVSPHVRALDRRLMRERVALNAAVFYPALLAYAPEHREPLLDFQQRAAAGHPLLTGAFDLLHGWIGRRLTRAVKAHFA